MKYIVTIIPKKTFNNETYDVTTFHFNTIKQVIKFVKIIMSASNDSNCLIMKVDGK